jgi:hypothetical protein
MHLGSTPDNFEISYLEGGLSLISRFCFPPSWQIFRQPGLPPEAVGKTGLCHYLEHGIKDP